MPVRRKARRTEITASALEAEEAANQQRILCQFKDEDGEPKGGQILLPVSSSVKQLDQTVHEILETEPDAPFSFFLDGEEIHGSLAAHLLAKQKEAWRDSQLKAGRRFRPSDIDAIELEVPSEAILEIHYKPQAIFKVQPINRMSASLDGHSEAVLVVAFSPEGELLATGGGDKIIRIWDLGTCTPMYALTQHKHWVQVLSWSPDGRRLASGSRDGGLICWRKKSDIVEKKRSKTDADDEEGFVGENFRGHSNYLSHISWEPVHVNLECDRFVSASKDESLKVWKLGVGLQFSLNGHQKCVTCVKWGGLGKIYSSSQDTTLMVWSATDGSPIQVLKGHAHWVNFIALNTDAVLRTGWFDHECREFSSRTDAQAYAKQRFENVLKRSSTEVLASCSDDNTMFLWKPSESPKSIARLTGHQGAIFSAAFSPDGRYLASCSADKSIKLWDAETGKFVTTFRGHVGAVYHISWSADSRLLVSGSRDTTLKLWSASKHELVEDLPGHADEIFSTDWSPSGGHVATGSKDKKVKVWVA